MTWKPRSIWAATCVALTCALFINTSCAVMPSAIPPLATTIAATLAPTATSTVLDQHILWSADHETGDLSQWDGAWISATGDARISTDHAHSGRYSAALTVYNAVGGSESPGVRMAKVSTPQNAASLPDEAYYSVWYYFPQTVRPAEWWNIFQWKRRWERNGEVSSDPVYTIDVANRPDGAMYLYLYSEVGVAGNYNTAGVGARAAAAIDLPLNRWVHLECYYRWSLSPTGRVACWQDGQQIWDVASIITDYDYGAVENPRQWTVNNYTNQTDPPTQTIYIDDAAISTTQLSLKLTTYLPVIIGYVDCRLENYNMDLDQAEAITRWARVPVPRPPLGTWRTCRPISGCALGTSKRSSRR